MSAAATEVFVLVGPHTGKDLAINGHEFREGEFHFQGNHEQVASLTNVFSYYGAVPKVVADKMALERELATLRAQVQHATIGEPATQPMAAIELSKDTTGEQPAAPTATVSAEAVAAFEADLEQTSSAVPSLGEAIGALDPESDLDWTSNNLPSLDRLAALTGKKPSRDDVEAIATGYTRAKARSARGG